MDALVTLIADNALGLLLVALVSGLGGALLVWRWIGRASPALWRRAAELWRWVVDLPPLSGLRGRFPRLWAFLGRRLAPEGYLGLHLTIGLIALLAALQLFLTLVEAVRAEARLAAFDRALVAALAERSSATTLTAFGLITHLGDPPLLAAIGLLVGLILLVRRRWLRLIVWTVGLAGGGLLNLTLKTLFQRERPSLPNPFATATGWSFPSGHAMGALITYVMLAYLLVRALEWPWRPLTVLALAALVLLIGASRVYLGVHYPSDILAGYVAGTAWLTVCITGAEVARRQRRARAT